MAEAVKVIVRCRPLNQREKDLNCEVIVAMDHSIMQVELKKPKSSDIPKQFAFDGVYFVQDNTKMIYDDICFDLVTGVLDGYNGTVFAYGQTGCGKSFTMMGVEHPAENRGIIPRAFGHIFDEVALKTSVKYLVRASYLEIYNEEVRDLLSRDSKKKLELKEHPEKGVYVKDLSVHKVHNVQDLEAVMELGGKNRSVGATLMNVDSSRSHSIFIIDIERADEVKGQTKIRAGRLNLVDLAGSERQSKTGATGERLKEATKINLSLSALGNVISALVDGKSKHIPYRDSKLTRLLQSSLGGNTKTLMTACISPAEDNYEETLSTLRYANRAKNIKNKPKINEDPKDALLREYQEEIKQLKMLLEGQNIPPMAAVGGLVGGLVAPAGPSEDQQKMWEEEKEAIRREYEGKIQELTKNYGKEKANKTKLEKELGKLQEERNRQLMSVDEKKESANMEAAEASGERLSAPMEGKQPKQKKRTKTDGVNNQQMAMKRLQQLEGELMGGEKAGDTSLKKKMEARVKAAKSYRSKLNEASLTNEDDIVIEKIFTNLTEEVYYKTKALEKSRDKLESTEQEIKDLSEEFQADRQDYLETIRRQDQTIRLFDQLLNTVAPLLRRDCNYYNIDKMKKDSKWDKEAGEWVIPKVTTSKTKLSSMTDQVSPAISNSSLVGRTGIEIMRVSGSEDEDWYLSQLHKSELDSSDYFKPKRAQEILKKQQQGLLSPIQQSRYDAGGSSSDDSSNSNLSNAAAIHGVDTFNVGNLHRKEKLQALPTNTSFRKLPPPEIDPLNGKRKLKPLGDIKHQK